MEKETMTKTKEEIIEEVLKEIPILLIENMYDASNLMNTSKEENSWLWKDDLLKALHLLADKMQEDFIERETDAFAIGLEKGAQKMQEENIDLKMAYNVRNDDAKDYSKVLTQKEDEIKEISLALKEFEEEIVNLYASERWETIKLDELKQLLHSKLGEFMEKGK